MKHILLVSQYFYPERFRVNDLALQLIKKGFRVTVLTGVPNYPKGKFFKGYNWLKNRKDNFHGVDVIRLPILPRGNNNVSLGINYLSFFLLGSLFALFTRKRFDLVFTYGISPIIQAIPGILYSKRRKVRSFLYIMDLWPFSVEAVNGIRNQRILKFISKISRWIYKNSNTLLISSVGYEKELIKMGIESQNIVYWPQYHEDVYTPLKKDFLFTPELDPKYFNFIFTGNLGTVQGIDYFIDFVHFKKNKLQEMSLKFNFMGDGKEKSNLIQLTKSLKLENLITFIPSKNTEEVPHYLANSNAALLILGKHPHLSEVLPAKVSSYVGCKIPIFCVSLNPLGSFIESNNYGLSTFDYDYNVIFKKLVFFVENYTQISNLSLLSEDLFNLESLIRKLIQLL